MTELEYNIATIKTQLLFLASEIKHSKKEGETQKNAIPEFVTLESAAKLKGGAAYNTYKTRYYLQPCGGTNSTRVGGKKCWKRDDVEKWLSVDDNELPNYLKQFGVTIKKY